jgi:hypothetical protein
MEVFNMMNFFKRLGKVGTLSLILVLSLATAAFAATSTSGKVGSYSTYGNLYPHNPIYSNPYADASTSTSAPLYYLKATSTVHNTDGTGASQSASVNNDSSVLTGKQYANTFTSSGVKFTGSHYVSDANVGSWSGSTSYQY